MTCICRRLYKTSFLHYMSHWTVFWYRLIAEHLNLCNHCPELLPVCYGLKLLWTIFVLTFCNKNYSLWRILLIFFKACVEYMWCRCLTLVFRCTWCVLKYSLISSILLVGHWTCDNVLVMQNCNCIKTSFDNIYCIFCAIYS